MEKFNIQEYLDSGVIEMYVLDQLNDAEREAVEKLATQYPEIREEIAEVEEAMGTYHSLEGLTPPAHILSNIMAATAPGTVAEPIVTALPKRTLSLLWPMAAAVIGLALAAWMYMGKQSAQQEIAALKKTTENLRANEQVISGRLQSAEKELNGLKDACCAEKLVVKGIDRPIAIASVFWDKKVRLAHLKLENLTDPGTDKQYQLWAFVGGKAVSIGVVDWQALQKGLVTFEFKNKPEAFAISLEPFGGSPAPTAVKGASGAVVNQG